MKKALSFILAVLLVLASIPAMALTATAADVPVTGSWTRGDTGDDATTTLTDGVTSNTGVDISWKNISNNYSAYYTLQNGVLTVYGTGELSGTASLFPWYSRRNEITKIVIAAGFTKLGSNIFSNYDYATEVVVGEGVTEIGGDCFAYMDRLTTITLPSTLVKLSQGVAYGSNQISTVYIAPGWSNSNLTSVGAYNDALTNTSKQVAMTYTPIDCAVWGWENWTGSPNKTDDYPSVTQLLVTLENGGSEVIPMSQNGNYDWYLTISCNNYGKTIHMAPTTNYGNMRRFEVCLGTGEDQFIPVKGNSYTVQVDIYEKSTGNLVYRSDAQSGFNCGMVPVIPNDQGGVVFTNGSCYVQADLGSTMPVKSIKLVNYVASRYYMWRAFGTNDLDTPISQWTYLGGKMNDEVSTADGYTIVEQLNAQNEYDAYRYVRIYGVYDSANSGYHFVEASIVSYSASNSYPITFVVGSGSYTILVDEGDTPVCPVSTDKDPGYTDLYTFTGWDTPIVPAAAAATYTAQYSESVRPTRTVNFNGWAGFENWGSPTNTQWLFEINGDNADFSTEASMLDDNNFNNYRWKFTITHVENGVTVTEVHNMKPWSTITNNHNFRLRPMDQDDAFYPVQGVEYTVVGLDVYDMTLTERFGEAGYHLYTNGSNTKTYTNNAQPTHMGQEKSLDDFCEITWTLDGSTVGTTYVLPGYTPTFPGDPLPQNKTEGGVDYILSSPVITAAAGDATYAYRYVRADGQVTISWIDETDPANNYSAEFNIGDTAVYAGAAADHMGADGYTWYTVNIEGNNTVAAEDATYQITWTTKDTRQLGIGKYAEGIENWSDGQTQFLVILSQDGGDFVANIDDYDWEITINGTPYDMAPSTRAGLWGSGYLYRFRPAVNEVFIPQAGAGNEYVVSVKLYQNGVLKYYTPDTVTLVTPADFVPMHDHTLHCTSVTTEPATCTVDGLLTYTCTDCGYVWTETLTKTGHTLIATEAVPATCTDAGNSAYWTCTVCHKYFSDAEGATEVLADSWIIPATGHTLSAVAAVPATCTEAGSSAYWTCTVCHKYFGDAEGTAEIPADSWIIPATGHNFDENGLCQNGCGTKMGARIGDTFYATLDLALAGAQAGDTVLLLESVTANQIVYNGGQNITLDLNGYEINARVTFNNGAVTVTGGTINGRFDVYDDATVTLAANATVNGQAIVWGDGTYGEAGCKTPTLNIYGTIVNTGDAAISTNGTDMSGACINIYDGAAVTSTDEIGIYLPSGNLTVSGGTVTGTTGIYVKSGSVAVSGGTVNGTGAAAEYSYNGNGGNATGDAIVFDSCGYPNGAPAAAITGGDFVSANAKAVASYGYNDNAPIEGFVSGGTFSSEVPYALCAGNLETALDTESGKYVVQEHTAHVWDEGTVTTAPTCATAGEKLCTCAVCGETRTEAVPATAHTLTAVAAVEATCAQAGNSAYWTCSVCGRYFSDEDGETEIAENSWIIEATGAHTCGDPVIVWNGYAASATKVCSVCGAVEAAPVTVTFAITTASTCTETGTLTYTATVDGTQISSTKDATLAKLAHSFGPDGICTVCGAEAVGYSTTVKVSEEKDTMAIRYHDTWEYVVYPDDTAHAGPEGWLDGTDTATWTTAQSSIGAQSWGSWTTKLDCQYYSLFLRKTFTVTDASKVSGMTFYFLYDEDPVVYINGHEVLSLTGYHDSGYNTYDFSAYTEYLTTGTNILQIAIKNAVGGGGSDQALVIHYDATEVDHTSVTKGSVWEYAFTGGTTTAEAPAGFLAGQAVAGTLYGVAPFVVPAYHNTTTDHLLYTILPDSTMTTYFRQFFDVKDAAAVTRLTLEWKYDENPIVYINGTQVHTESGYHDSSYRTVDLTAYKNLLVEGTNCLAVRIENAGGGSIFDAALNVVAYYDANGKIAPVSASQNGFAGFGSINAPENVLDGDQNSVCGSGFDANADQYVRIDFAKHEIVSSIFVQCKDEGTTSNADGTRGTYDVYALQDGIETLIASNVPAVTGTDGGYTVNLTTPVKADGIIVRVTSWQGDCWACVADIIATPAVYVYGHVYSAWTVTAEATCTADGSRTSSCEDCDEPDVVEAIKAFGHSWDDGVIKTKPTFTAEGVRTCTCTACGETRDEAIDVVILDVYEQAIVGEKDGKNTVSIVGTISDANIDLECADYFIVTVSYEKDGAMKTVSKRVKSIFSTVTDVATTSAETAAVTDLTYISAGYLFAVRLVGVTAGEHTLNVTIDAYSGTEVVVSAAKELTFTV